MRPNDPGLENSAIFSTNEMLQKVLGRDFAAASAPPAATEKIADLTLEQVDLQSYLLRLSSGFHDNQNPFAAVHQTDPKGDDKMEERRRMMEMRFRNASVFFHNGYDLSSNEFMDSFNSLIEKTEQEHREMEQRAAQAAEEAAQAARDAAIAERIALEAQKRLQKTEAEAELRSEQADDLQDSITVTDDEILTVNGVRVLDENHLHRLLNQMGPDAMFEGHFMMSETRVVDGVRVDASKIEDALETLDKVATVQATVVVLEQRSEALAAEVTTRTETAAELSDVAAESKDVAADLAAQASNLAVEVTQLQGHQDAIANGMDPNNLPPDVKDMVTDEFKLLENNRSTEPAAVDVAAQPAVLDTPQYNVTPTVVFDTTPKFSQ